MEGGEIEGVQMGREDIAPHHVAEGCHACEATSSQIRRCQSRCWQRSSSLLAQAGPRGTFEGKPEEGTLCSSPPARRGKAKGGSRNSTTLSPSRGRYQARSNMQLT
jgi:hypothetical protein